MKRQTDPYGLLLHRLAVRISLPFHIFLLTYLPWHLLYSFMALRKA